jgi:hypothetical protein
MPKMLRITLDRDGRLLALVPDTERELLAAIMHLTRDSGTRVITEVTVTVDDVVEEGV